MVRRWLGPIAAFLTMVASLTAVAPAHAATTYEQVASLTGTFGSQFGGAVAMSGDTIVVGASYAQRYGEAYVFTEQADGTWLKVATLTPKLRRGGMMSPAQFGTAVAMSGDTIVVGEYYTSGEGSVYVFVKPAGGWKDANEDAILTSGTGTFDQFGQSLAIDGDTVVAGASGVSSYQGRAYVYVKPLTGWATTGTPTAVLSASPATDYVKFGQSVAISGATIVVGAPEATNATKLKGGLAYVFTKPESGWATGSQTAVLSPSNPSQEAYFGTAVAVSGDTIAVGAYGAPAKWAYQGAAYVFVKPGSGWTNTTQTSLLTAASPANSDNLGASVGVWGEDVVAGITGISSGTTTGTGGAYVFTKPAAGWPASKTQDSILQASVPQQGARLGDEMAISEGRAVLGAPAVLTAYVFAKVEPPAAPTGVQVTRGDGTASVSFTAPDDGGAAITEYQYSLDGGDWVSTTPLTTASPLTVSGLTNGTTYSVRVRAKNAAGVGMASDAVTVTPCSVPGAPASVTVTPQDSSADVEVSGVSGGGCVVSDYEYALDSGSWTSAQDADGSFAIAGLRNGTAYKVAVRAVNEMGPGAGSEVATVTPRTVPGVPTSVMAVAGDGEVTVEFATPQDGGAAITGYEYRLDEGSWTAGTASPLRIGGLANGTEYGVRVRAVNQVGAGGASQEVRITPQAAPQPQPEPEPDPDPQPAPDPQPDPDPDPQPAAKQRQSIVGGPVKPPTRVQPSGVTLLTPAGLRTNTGAPIRTRVRVTVPGAQAQGEVRYFRILRGPQGKTSIRTYGHTDMRIVVVRFARGTDAYRPYRQRFVYVNGKQAR